MYYTYMLRCRDNSLYTGITTDVIRRFAQHRGEKKGGAKYTRARFPVAIERVWESESKSDAARLEYWLKKLSKADKEKLVEQPEALQDLLGEKLDVGPYRLLEVRDMVKEKILELKDEKWAFLGEVNPDMSLGVYGLFLGGGDGGFQLAVRGTFDEFDEASICVSPRMDCTVGGETVLFQDDPELLDFVYKQLHSSESFARFCHEYAKLQYEGVTAYMHKLIKDHEFLSLKKDVVEAEGGLALQFQGTLDSGLFISGLLYEIEDEYRNSYIDFAYEDFMYMSLSDYNYFVQDPYLKDYIIYLLINLDYTC